METIKKEFRIVTAMGNKIRFFESKVTYGRYKNWTIVLNLNKTEATLINQNQVFKVLIDEVSTAKLTSGNKRNNLDLNNHTLRG